MNNILSKKNKKNQELFDNYQQQLALSLQEIEAVMRLLDQGIQSPDEAQRLSEKIQLANQIVTQINHRLETLKAQGQLRQPPSAFAETKNHQEIQDLMAHKLEKIRQKTEQWEYIQ